MSSQHAQIEGLYRYPVKGLSPEPMRRVTVSTGQTLPADRRYAIETVRAALIPRRLAGCRSRSS